MTRVMAVEFERYGRLFYLDPDVDEYRVGDRVLFPTETGFEVAVCVWPPQELEWQGQPLPKCGGLARQSDLERDQRNRELRQKLVERAEEIIANHELPMKIVGIDIEDRIPDCDRLVAIYYTAPTRVDFRRLVGALASALRAKIDLRQVGMREAASLIGGCGTCGRELCCVTMGLPAEPIPLSIVKDQEISGDPLQIAGVCGRLKCCLSYEQERLFQVKVRRSGNG